VVRVAGNTASPKMQVLAFYLGAAIVGVLWLLSLAMASPVISNCVVR
jgi:hypothetical protein